MSKKITFIESASEMGGVQFSTLYLASHLSQDLWNVVVVCPEEGKLSDSCREVGIQVEIVSMPRFLSTSLRIGRANKRIPNLFAWIWNSVTTLFTVYNLRIYLLKCKPDIVFTKGMYSHICGGIASKLTNVKCIWHLQDFISERFFGFYRTIFGLLSYFVPTEIVVDGTPIATQLPLEIQNRVSIILNGVDIQVFKPNIDSALIRKQFSIRPDELVVGHVARITPWKGQLHLLEAFGKIAARNSNVRLLLVGAPVFDNDAYEQLLYSKTKELGLSNQVIFAGFRTDLPQVLSAMDIFAYSSVEKDTSPLALLSAMACGLPIVAFAIEGVHEVIGEDGLLIPVGDETKLAEAIESLLLDTTFRNQLGMKSRQKAVACFSLEKYVQAMESVMQRIVNK